MVCCTISKDSALLKIDFVFVKAHLSIQNGLKNRSIAIFLRFVKSYRLVNWVFSFLCIEIRISKPPIL